MGVIMFLLSLFIYNLLDLINRTKTEVKKNTLVTASNSFTPSEDISVKGVQIAFKTSDFYDTVSLNDPYYGTLILQDFLVTIISN